MFRGFVEREWKEKSSCCFSLPLYLWWLIRRRIDLRSTFLLPLDWYLFASSVYCSLKDHNEYNSSMAKSQTNTARIDGLRPGMVYVVQVRARTVAGYGKYSGKMCFQTLTDGECAQQQKEREKEQGVELCVREKEAAFFVSLLSYNWIKSTCLSKPLPPSGVAWREPGDLQRCLINCQLED